MGRCCRQCGGAVQLDALSGIVCCVDCGSLRNEDSEWLASEHQAGFVGERGGYNIEDDGSRARGSSRRYTNYSPEKFLFQKKSDALKRVEDLGSMLKLSQSIIQEVEHLIERVTSGQWGMGRWFGILAGACTYIVVRKRHIPLTLVEVAYHVDCDVSELGRMFSRVLNSCEVNLPKEDPIVFIERAMSSNETLSNLERATAQKIVNQCRVLLNWMQQWYVSTGRHLLPVAAAVLLVILEANKISIGLNQVSQELHTQAVTVRKRYKEIQEAFVASVKNIPWCKAITVKNVCWHFDFILRYLESSLKSGKRKTEDQPEAADEIHIRKKAIVALPSPEVAAPSPSPSRSSSPSPSSSTVAVLPKSFVRSEIAQKRRVMKIREAKLRLSTALRGDGVCREIVVSKEGGKEGRLSTALRGDGVCREIVVSKEGGKEGVLDIEDITIEQLILLGVNERQIEDGYYQALIASVRKESQIRDEDIMQYIYSKEEALCVAKLRSLLEELSR